MIRIYVLIALWLGRLIPFFSRIAVYTSAIWAFIKSVASKPAAWIFLSFYPVLEFLIELFTGHRGVMSTFLTSMLSKVFDYLLNIVFHVDLQSAINAIPENILHYCCFIGLLAALQNLYDGIVSAMVVLMNIEITLAIFWLKARLFKITLTKM